MTICYFGIYDPDYSRNRELISGLGENKVKVIECRVDPAERFKYWKLFKKHQAIGQYDIMVIGFPGHPVVPLAKLICRKPIVFDALVSLYDSNIFDRKSASPRSLEALKCWFLDWLACKMADRVLLDAQEHINYFVKTFRIKKDKFRRILVGTNQNIFYPRENRKTTDKFLLLFQGTYIPLQGVEYMIRAAKLLENDNVQLDIIGKIKTYGPAIELAQKLKADNVKFIDFMPQTELAERMAEADVCLGFFGDTPKAKRCGAFKVTEALAMKKAMLTADTPAMREFLVDRQDCLFCQGADAEDLAEKIMELKNNPELRNRIAENGYKVYQEKLTPQTLGRELKSALEELI
ncbi:MAG: glycosyltransferase [Candidatus Nealsonbacteria bacterium]|nr:glycosyltransferase [Candidatus Nealsonbacteria bacterium]